MLSDYSDLLKVMKRAAVEAVEANNPVNVCFGEVTSTAPLEVVIDQKLPLGKAQLIVSERVTEKPLSKNDGVILLRQQGGQKYVIMDRIGVIE